MKILPAALVALMLVASPAAAFSVDINLPNLTFPDDVTTSTKGCDPVQTTVCAPTN